uniref:cell division cycle protein 20 homolog B n=1 Tax=Euleptes europaea TaxID=460621 RepID=UPI002540D0F8|nr:cell division cycle protein 20 homolog B [Euleptes europaea]
MIEPPVWPQFPPRRNRQKPLALLATALPGGTQWRSSRALQPKRGFARDLQPLRRKDAAAAAATAPPPARARAPRRRVPRKGTSFASQGRAANGTPGAGIPAPLAACPVSLNGCAEQGAQRGQGGLLGGCGVPSEDRRGGQRTKCTLMHLKNARRGGGGAEGGNPRLPGKIHSLHSTEGWIREEAGLFGPGKREQQGRHPSPQMEWKLERSAGRKVKTDEEVLWVNRDPPVQTDTPIALRGWAGVGPRVSRGESVGWALWDAMRRKNRCIAPEGLGTGPWRLMLKEMAIVVIKVPLDSCLVYARLKLQVSTGLLEIRKPGVSPRSSWPIRLSWGKIMKALGTDLRQIRKQSLQMLTKGYPDMKLPDGHPLHGENQEFQVTETPGKTSYSQFKSCIVKKLASQIPVASSPIATRRRQECTRNQAEQTFAECSPSEFPTLEDRSDFTESFGRITTIPVYSRRLTETTVGEPIIFTNTTHVNEGSETEKQKCLHQMMVTKENRHGISEQEGFRICEKPKCLWKGCKDGTKIEHDAHSISAGTEKSLPLEPEIRFHISGLRNDYYLNLLDWSHRNLLAVALGSVLYIWNGETNQNVKSIDLCSSCKYYVASIAWMRENPWLAFATSDGEVQLWDIETQKRLRTMFGHLSVVGALSWNGPILSSGSRLGYIHHHDVRAAQHHIGRVRQSKQSVCSLQWSPDRKLLASGSSDGLLNIWPNDPGVTGPLSSISHSSAVKAMMWCPWQSAVIATGGGIKDRTLHIWNISSMKSLERADTRSQICSLLWLPNTKELITGEGYPWNKMSVWRYPMLSNSAELCDHKGRVLHMALSPEGNRIFSAGADETAYVWKYRRMKPNTMHFQEENCFN